MPRFAANLTMMFNEVDFLDRFEAAAKAGFKGVEYLFPYDYEKEELVERLRSHGLTQVLHNLPAGDWDAGERGIACHPDRVSEFREGVGRAIEYAGALGCGQVNCLAGIAPEGADDEALRETLVSNLRYAAPLLAEAGVCLLIEPINTRDIPGFYLNYTAQGRSIIEEVGSENLRLQYDLYHAQIMEGDLARTFQERTWTSSATYSWRTTQVGTSRARGRSTTPSYSTPSTGPGTRAGSAASTCRKRPPRRAWAGSRRTCRSRS